MASKSRKRDLRTVIDISLPIDKVLWDFVNSQAECEHRSLAGQVRYMLETAMDYIAHANSTNTIKFRLRQEGGGNG